MASTGIAQKLETKPSNSWWRSPIVIALLLQLLTAIYGYGKLADAVDNLKTQVAEIKQDVRDIHQRLEK